MFSEADLNAYLDEGLPAAMMAAIEEALRRDSHCMAQLKDIVARRDSGVHSLGEIWRRHRLGCLGREQLGSYLLGVISDEEADYVAFHINTIGCRYCQANLDDLKAQQSAAADRAKTDRTNQRRKKYFNSSAGHLHSAKR
jgi:hypothetical protein